MNVTRFFVLFVYPLILLASMSANTAPVNSSKMFVLTSEEMVFASKLSDENRHRFCYTFSPEERTLALTEAKSLSPNESVEKIQVKDSL